MHKTWSGFSGRCGTIIHKSLILTLGFRQNSLSELIHSTKHVLYKISNKTIIILRIHNTHYIHIVQKNVYMSHDTQKKIK